MSNKTILCHCEDVTLHEVEQAVSLGHRDVESVKRYTGFGTGQCQGKHCLAGVAKTLRRLGCPADRLAPFTPRTPVEPVTIGALASIDPEPLGPPDHGVPPVPPLRPPPPRSETELPARADVVIIGGGIMGLGLAWNLAVRGVRDVLVIDRGYLNAGASGRNGGGVRAQWSTPTMIRLARRSIDLMKSFATRMKINVWFRQGGYLFLAPDGDQAKRLEKNAQLHHQHGVQTRVITPREALEVVPQLDPKRFVAAAYNPGDAVIFPWPFLWGYANQAEALGVKVRTFTRATGFEIENGSIRAVETDAGKVRCETVVNACGAWSQEVAKLAGVDTPNRPTRHEILTTEPLKPWLDPLVSVLGNGLYFSQSARGELIGGMGDPQEPPGISMGSTLRFLARFSRALADCAPLLRGIKVTRQWAGCYDVTPDNNPILGAAGPKNFLQLHGFVGHGFMMAPAVTELMADWMVGKPKDEIFDRFTLERFKKGELVKEDFIIG